MLNKWHLHIIGHACHRKVKQRIHWIHRCTHSGRIIFTTMLLPLCTLWQNLRQGANKNEREKERLSISPPPLLPPDWGYIFSQHWAWQLAVSNLQERISLAAEGMGDYSLLFYLQYTSIAGKRVREENCSRLLCQFHMDAEELWKG